MASIRELERMHYERQRQTYIASLPKRTASYKPGDYVLVSQPGENKLLPNWHGPMAIVEQTSPFEYRVRNLVDATESSVASARLKRFVPGSLSADQLRDLAAPPGEFIVDSVLEHRNDPINGLEFLIKWNNTDIPPSWIKYAGCATTAAVVDYMKKNRIQVEPIKASADRPPKPKRGRGRPRR
jgi:hypothetical protein